MELVYLCGRLIKYATVEIIFIFYIKRKEQSCNMQLLLIFLISETTAFHKHALNI